MSIDIEHIKRLKVAKIKTQRSLLFFTRYFFKERQNKKFTVNNHHEIIADTLEKVMRGELTRVIINIAPRYGKTELAVKNFIAHSLAVNPSAKFIHLSYSDTLALDNSEEIKDLVQSAEYQQLFPNVQIKKDAKSKQKWYTTDGGGVYATSSSGQVTGFGAGQTDFEESQNISEFITDIEHKQGFGGAIIIDDPIKPDDAESSTIRNRVNNKFDSTIRNRVNSRKTPIIIIMQRLHPDDLCGHLIKNDLEDWHVVSLPCIYKNEYNEDIALWPAKHTLEELHKLRGSTKASIGIFDRQYMQNPKPMEGLLYSEFKTYNDRPIGVVLNYTDTADQGSDYLCSISYIKQGHLYYVVDVYYSQDRNEITEPQLSQRLKEVNVNICRVESNAGGRSFCRNIERISREIGNYGTKFQWFHQSKNKESRIKSNSSTVNNCVIFPSDWQVRWPDFYDHVTCYMAEGKNDHDDSVDVLTGIVENFYRAL